MKILVALVYYNTDIISEPIKIVSSGEPVRTGNSSLPVAFYHAYCNPFHSISVRKIIHFLGDPPFM